jgi:ElaB/YqjD/DUF883 family membrane-anchored ribosome-binding protein
MTIPKDFPSPDELAAKAKETVRKVGDHLTEHASQLRDSAADARYNAENFIQNNPWPSVALAVGVGFLFGVIVSRGRS